MITAIEPLGGHDRAAFSCGAAALDIERRSNIMAENYSFSVILEPQEGGGFTVLVPALPEVVTEGDDEKEALANAEEAIRAILAYRRDNGIAIPADARPEVRRITIAA
jgi:antitoxin HicB